MAGEGGSGGTRTHMSFRTLALQASAPPLGDASIRYILPAKAKISALGETRTHNRFLRREVLYPVKLRALIGYKSGGDRTRTCKPLRAPVFETGSLPFGAPHHFQTKAWTLSASGGVLPTLHRPAETLVKAAKRCTRCDSNARPPPPQGGALSS